MRTFPLPANKQVRFRAALFSIVCLMFLSAIVFPLDPQKKVHTYPMSKWDVDKGLPQNSVMSITQSRDKYIWLGTERGLVRFDGVHFTVFNSAKDKNIRNNRTTTLLEDKNGNLWWGSRGGGLNRMKDGEIEHFEKKDGLKDDFVLSLFEDMNGIIWVGTFKGLSRIETDGRLSIFDPEGKFDGKIIVTMTETPDGRIWAGTYNSGIYSIAGNRVNEYRVRGAPADLPIRAFLVDRNGRLWAGTNGRGLAAYSDDKFDLYEKNHLLSNQTVFSLYEDTNHNIWIGTAGGLNRLAGDKLSTWNEDSVLSQAIIRSLFEDHEGSLWVGTNTLGLLRLQDGKFDSLSVQDGLSADNITCIYHDSKGGIWIGTDGQGVNYINSTDEGIIRILTSAQGIASDFVYSVTEDLNGRIWIGTNSGITVLDRLSLSVSSRISGKGNLPNDIINVLYTGNDGSVWAGTAGGGIIRFADGKSTLYSTENGLSNNFIHSIYEDREGSIWIGTYGGGLNLFRNGEFTNYNSNSGLTNNFVFSVIEDKKGRIWLGTGGGVNLIHEGKVYPLNQTMPVFTDTIYNILVTENNDLWLTSDMGLFHIRGSDTEKYLNGDLTELPCRLYNSRDGLNSDECRGGIQPAGFKSLSGKLFIPTTKGVSIFDPGREQRNIPEPPVYIESIHADHPFENEHGIAVFPGKTRKIDFSFTALSFLAPERVEFRVKLEGFDEDWTMITDPRNRTVSYTNLSAGAYNFRVVASNSDGVWNNTGAEFKFRIRSQFYSSPLFYAMIGLGLLILFIFLYNRRIRNVGKREAELKWMVDERTKELRSSNMRLTEANEQKSELLSMAAHDLKNPLQAIIGFSELISLRQDCPENIKKNAHLILEASRGMLETINNTLNITVIREGKVTISNEELIDLTELSRLVVEIYSEFAKKKNQIVITRFWSDCFIKGEKERIKIVIENLLSNAIKYSPLNRNIILSVQKTGKNVVLSVKDEGSGFSEEDRDKMFEKFRRLSSKPTAGESSTGIGLSIVKKIVDLHRGKIWLESTEGEGSIFFVSFPAVTPVDTWKVK